MSTGDPTLRLPSGGRIDRDAPLRFTYDGHPYTGYRGDTLASALLANGAGAVARSVERGRERGILSAGVEEPNALVQVLDPATNAAPGPAEPMLPATTVELRDGLAATGLAGRGWLPGTREGPGAGTGPEVYDRMYRHCDVLVVGTGPAGLAAALAAGRSGARVLVTEADSEPGGSLLGTPETLDGAPATDWVATATRELAGLDEVTLLTRTTVVGYYDHNYLLALQRRTDHLDAPPPGVPRQRLWHLRARRVVLATGAHERPIAFAGNDRPGVMLAASARTYLHRFAVLAGRRAVVFTTNDSAYPAALELARAGVAIPAVVDARPDPPESWAARCAASDIPVLAGHHVVGTRGGGHGRVAGAELAPAGEARPGVAASRGSLDCDTLLVSGGWNPAVHLFSQAGGELRYDGDTGTFVPVQAETRCRVAGAASGVGTLAGCLRDGADAGARAAGTLGFGEGPAGRPPAAETPHVPHAEADEPATPPAVLWSVPDPGEGEPFAEHFVDLARDVTVADIHRAVAAGARSLEHVKRYTTAGTGPEQGKTSAALAAGVAAAALDRPVAELGVTSYRPPYTPVAFAALAGRERGHLFDPVRTTPIHAWHAAHGAVFEDVGQWKRPWYFPRQGEALDEAVWRECRAAREGVALMDASTLGKIELQGPDAAEFLDRVYTNRVSTLKVGRIRYGVLCTCDGMVFDDGTVQRLADERFLVTTTTGNAAAVLAWFEEWLQTEWTDLSVYCTSVTDQWATIALVGPRARAVLARVTSGPALDAASFGFMSAREATVAGVPARICRVSFSGELAYEINVTAWYALQVWEALVRAGEDYGITPYGTETMHVLRAEKGFIIVGQDTDGQVTPLDLGMGGLVSKTKEHFLGKRSLSRPDLTRPDRRQLVALLPADPAELIPEGAQLIASETVPEPPVEMLGHVTSSYRSAALDRTFALALVRGGRDRIGGTVYAALPDRTVPATVSEPMLYDREGARRDG